MIKRSVLILSLFSLSLTASAQSFSSGSTGADGALDLSSGNLDVQLPDSGVLNYTTINVPAGRALSFKRNLRNTPVILLAQGQVTIAGQIAVSADRNVPGPGGFFGGGANLNGGAGPNLPGLGPGGGPQQDGNRNGKWVGPLTLSPIVGGSGGSGGSQCTFVGQSPYGGGGGGAIIIASSQSITITNGGSITAQGAGVECPFGGAGGGSGGAIRLVANSLTVAGGLMAQGAGIPNGPAFDGVIRLEAPVGQVNFTGGALPAAGIFTINPTVGSNTPPSLVFISIAGFAVPSYSGKRFDTYDMLLPNQLTDPISVVVHASNIPVGTQVTVGFVNGSPNATSTPGTLSGTFESSSATASISNLNRTAVTYLLATATFDPPMGAMRFNPKGPNHVAKIRVVASPGGKPKFVFLRRNGSEIDQTKVSKRFLEQLGL